MIAFIYCPENPMEAGTRIAPCTWNNVSQAPNNFSLHQGSSTRALLHWPFQSSRALEDTRLINSEINDF